MTSTFAPRSATLQTTVAASVHDELTRIAEARSQSTAGLLRTVVEAYVATVDLPATPLARLPRDSTAAAERRVAAQLARAVDRHGSLTRSAAWRCLSTRDRQTGGQDLLDAAVSLGVREALFVTAEVDGKLWLSQTMAGAAADRR